MSQFYDQWKTRDDAPDDDEPDQEMIEAEHAIHDAEQAFDVLIEHWGIDVAARIMLRIIRKRAANERILRK